MRVANPTRTSMFCQNTPQETLPHSDVGMCGEFIELKGIWEIASQPLSDTDPARLNWYQERYEQARSDLIAHREVCLICKPQSFLVACRTKLRFVSQTIQSYFRASKFYSQTEMSEWKRLPARNAVQPALVVRNGKDLFNNS
jgi:hypothetical protein